jgi:hypothetical protein
MKYRYPASRSLVRARPATNCGFSRTKSSVVLYPRRGFRACICISLTADYNSNLPQFHEIDLYTQLACARWECCDLKAGDRMGDL